MEAGFTKREEPVGTWLARGREWTGENKLVDTPLCLWCIHAEGRSDSD